MKYIITGPSGGLGLCLTRKLLSVGDVAGISRSSRGLETLPNISSFEHFIFDLSRANDPLLFDTFMSSLVAFLGSEEYTIVINASMFYEGEVRLEKEKFSEMFEINFFSTVKLVNRLTLPKLRRILFINSISGLIGQVSQPEYCASKHALMGFARSIAKKAKYLDFDVMCINPGGMKTGLWDGYSHVNTTDFLEPEAVAEICFTLLNVPQRLFIQEFILLPPSDVS